MDTTEPAPAEAASDAEAWGHFYEGVLNWNAHATNIVHHLPYLARVLQHRPSSILEVGSGSGSMSAFLSYMTPRVVSIDLSRTIVERCRKETRPLFGRARYAVADAFHLDERGERYSIAVSQGLMEHFDDDQIGRLVEQQLKVCDRVSFSVPNAAYGKQDFGNERLLTVDEWRRLLKRLGLKVSLAADYRPLHWDRRLWRTLFRMPPLMTMCFIEQA